MNYNEWEATVPATTKLQAFAEDATGNIEPKPHVFAPTNTSPKTSSL